MNKTCLYVQWAQRKNKHAIKLIEVNDINAAINICARFRDSTEKVVV